MKEIPGFLTAEECEGIVDSAKEVGMSNSMTVEDAADSEREKEGDDQDDMDDEERDEMFKRFDRDMNGLISLEEVERTLLASSLLFYFLSARIVVCSSFFSLLLSLGHLPMTCRNRYYVISTLVLSCPLSSLPLDLLSLPLSTTSPLSKSLS